MLNRLPAGEPYVGGKEKGHPDKPTPVRHDKITAHAAEMDARARRYFRKKAREREKQIRGWRGIVFSRWFAGLALCFAVGLYENPWLAVWIAGSLLAGCAAAFLTRRSRNQTGKSGTMPEWASNY